MANNTTTVVESSLLSNTNNNFIITWLDSNLDESNEDIRNTINQFENIVNCVKIFIDADQCFNYLQDIKNNQVFVILSDSFEQWLFFFLNLIEEMPQIYSVYIISNDDTKFNKWLNKYKKLKGIFNTIETIFDILKQDIDQSSSDNIPSNNLDPSYIYSKLLIEIILKIEYNNESKQTFINYCRELYADNNSLLKMMDEFERSYRDHSPIWWYTKESGLYSIISKALRTFNVDLILKMGFFIQDLHREIEQLHSNTQYTEKVIVYRGQGISHSDFEKMKKNIGGLLSFNTFLSTTTDRDVCLIFAESNQDNPDMVGVLFQMEINPSTDSSTSFANIDNLRSYLGDDSSSEILISLNSIFRIDAIEQIQDRLWQINIRLINDIDSPLKSLIDCIRNEIEDKNIFNSLALLLNKIGYFDRALEINTTLLDSISSAQNYNNIGLIYQSMGDYTKALSCFEKTLENDQNSLPSNHPSLAITFNNIAGLYQLIGNYSLSLSYNEKALEIKEKNFPLTHPSFAITYNNIGEVYKSMGEYFKAFSYFEKALEIQENTLPCYHPSIAITYNNIGSIHRSIGNYSIALLSYKKTLNIELHSLQSDHPSFAITYNNIGLQYSFLKDYPTALTYYTKALDIARKFISFDQTSLALIYNNIGEVYDSMANYTSALSFYEKALEIQQKYLSVNHPELAAVYNNIGEVYRAQKNYSIALTFYEKTLEIEQKIFPLNHSSLAITYTNMAVTLEAQEQYKDAIKYTVQALDILQHVFGVNHFKTKETQVYLDQLQQKL